MNTHHAESKPGNVLIQGGRVIDPASGFDQTADVLLAGGIVASIGRISEQEAADGGPVEVIDAEGCLVTPGLIDIHVHFREPGSPDKETIKHGAAAAVNGGFTSVCCMPNTNPPLDSPAAIEFVHERAREANEARVFVVAAATAGRAGDHAGPLRTLAQAGAVAFSDDGDVIESAGVMRDVLLLARDTGRPMMQHCQDVSLARGGVMNAGALAVRLGLGGWPRVAEEIIIERDLRLNREIGCAYHVQHVSSAGSVAMVRRARKNGQPVTAEASPHHLLLTEDACRGYNTLAKMNPPLRTAADIAAINEGVADGTITILATDHAPHTLDEKARDFAAAPFGVVGLECALSLYAKALIEDGVLDWPHLLAMMTSHPASLVGLDRSGYGSLTVGGPADITVIDPDLEWTIDAEGFRSKGRNCPFDGRRVQGRAIATFVGGRCRLIREGQRARMARA